jgi:hypothetical protein
LGDPISAVDVEIALAVATAEDATELSRASLFDLLRALSAPAVVIAARYGPSVAAAMLRAVADEYEKLNKG